MLRTTDRCSSRSGMAAAAIGSSKIFPQDGMPRLVVSALEPFRYRWVMTWNSAAAPSDCIGRRPTPAMIRDPGPAPNRQVGAQWPSLAALSRQATALAAAAAVGADAR